MRLIVQRVKDYNEFAEVINCAFLSYAEPHNDMWTIISGSSKEAYTEHAWQAHTRDEHSQWWYVRHDKEGEVVAGGAFSKHGYSRFPDGKPEKPDLGYIEEGPKKQLAETVIQQFLDPRPQRMNQPHILLEYFFTLPAYRRLGAASLLMNVACKLADELKLPCWVESSPVAVPLYRAFGFKEVDRTELTGDEHLNAQDPIGRALPFYRVVMFREASTEQPTDEPAEEI